MSVILKAENISKQYRLGLVGTGTISHDLNRWWSKIRGKDDPYLKVGDNNDRSTKGESQYVWALQDINFEVKRGEVLGIIGKNGAGKSTLLKILSKVTSPTTGEIKTRGRIASLLEVGTGFHGEMTGRENIYLNGAILGMTKKEIASKIDEIIDFSGCQRYIDTPVKRYSSGMTVRLAFAVAAFLEPEILVIDEVLAVGDAEFQKKAIGKMQDISKGEGRTVLFVSHNMAAVKSLCTRGVVLEHGKVVFEGGIEKAINHYLSIGKLSVEDVNTTLGVFNLENHKDKTAKGFGIIEAKVFVNGVLSEHLESGSNLMFELTIISNRDLFKPEVGFAIKDENDISFIALNNINIGKTLNIEKGLNIVRIEIKDFPIYASGNYFINFYFGDDGSVDYECLMDAINIKNVTHDVYASGRQLVESLNKIYHKSIEIKRL